MFDVVLTQQKPTIIEVRFSGNVDEDGVKADRRFGELVKAQANRPFRVVCDFGTTMAMAPGIAERFMRAQALAVSAGMTRDAFVSRSQVLRLQLSRLAVESNRSRKLGPLRFFDDLEQAYLYVREP